MNRSAWFRVAGTPLLCLAFLPAGVFADPPAKDKETAKPAVLDAAGLAARIDAHLAAKWDKDKVKPATLTNDTEFARRVYLDIAGRIPRVSEIHTFLVDTSPDKRKKLINELLDSHAYVGNFTSVWRDFILPMGGNNQFVQGNMGQLEAWLNRKLRDNTPYDLMAREILTAQTMVNRGGLPGGVPQAQVDRTVAAFYAANEYKPENVAAATSRLFLGIKLECAQCHDHPFNVYSKQQFWEYAAFFGGMRPQGMDNMRFTPPGDDPMVTEIKIPNTDKVVKAKFLNGKSPEVDGKKSAREALAEWMTADDNPYFARAVVNRLWAHFYGVGIIDPVDEPSPENPPSHPELLDEMARQFVLNKYDLKYLIRAITLAKAYQLSSAVTNATQNDPRQFARMNLKGLSPEQLYDSLVLATGFKDPNQLSNRGAFRQRFFGVEGDIRNKFANYADKRTEFQTSILQALTLMNGSFVRDATSLEQSQTLAGIVKMPLADTEGRLNALFLAAVSRKMTDVETSKLVRYVDQGGPSGDSAKALGDVFWALLNSSEFILNH